MAAIDDIIEKNKGLVYNQLWRFNLAEDPEAESIAYEALYTAITSFNKSGNTKLSTYASVCIYNALGNYCRHLNRKKQLEVLSYHAIAPENDCEFIDLVAGSTDVEGDYIRKETDQFVRSAFEEQLASLTNTKHIEIIKVWSDYDFSISTSAIAKEVNVSQSYVSQVLNTFKARLKTKLEGFV